MSTLMHQPPEQKSATQTIAALTQSDKIVGAAAFQFAKSSFGPMLEDVEFTGALYVLSGFTPAQLAGFVEAATREGDLNNKLQIRFPATELAGFGIPEDCLVHSSAVGVRNADRMGRIVITSDTEGDVSASLGNKVTVEADQLKEAEEAAQTWTNVVSQIVDIPLPEGTAKQVTAMIKGLFECGRFPTGTAARFISAVLAAFKEGTPLLRAAGIHLPELDLPRFEDCFLTLGPAKSGHPSQWRKRFEEHQKQDSYLGKRQPNGLLLDPEPLRKKLEILKADDASPKLPDATLEAFEAYIEAEGTRCEATEELLFNHDWSHVRNCFDRQKKTSAKAFVERTRHALVSEAITTSPEDEAVLGALKQNPRKSGEATEEFKDFFDTYEKAIALDPKLLLEWEDFIYGRRIACTDLFDGILECLQRTIRVRDLGLETWLEIQGVKQDKPNHFRSANSRACEYFERHYGQLEKHSSGLIRFKRTKLPKYSTEVKPVLVKEPKNRKRKTRSSAAKAFEFHVSIFQRANQTSQRIATLPLTWVLPKDSVLMLEGSDLDALLRFRSQGKKTALAEGLANYETVGRKGLPLSLSLHFVQGFASSPGASGRGSFIPAQTKIHSLASEIEETISQAESSGWLAFGFIRELRDTFNQFDEHYGNAIESLARDSLDTTHTATMAKAYRDLLDKTREVSHENTRLKILRSILRIGSTTVDKSSHRPKLAVICPWHPLRMEASAARSRQLLDAITSLLTEQPFSFSDGKSGNLFFREMREVTSTPLQPEVTVCWEGMEPKPLVASQSAGGYTLHEPTSRSMESRSFEDNATESAKTIMEEIDEYLRLQPHERDNLSILLYNCDSPELPGKLVESLNKRNQDSKSEKVTCQVILTHHDENHLRHLYRDLVASSDSDRADSEDTTGDFLSKVRINITAANRLKHEGRAQPADIAYCRDLLSAEAQVTWDWIERQTVEPERLRPHQWNRLRPFQSGDRTVRVLLCCPAQTETGWAFLHSIAFLCASGADNAWSHDQCPVPMRTLNFDNQDVERILRETHELAVWVVNQDELLDRRLLEQKDIKVIRYIQSTTQGRNLIISSTARDTLLVNTLKERLAAILPANTLKEVVDSLVRRLINDANSISGGLVLRAARRANNTSELLGMVLSRYLVHSELGLDRPAAWCFLDDYSHWLGKKEGANIADLLVLAPTFTRDGKPHLDIIITEAKFVANDGVSVAKATSEKQLADTLIQISQALATDPKALDQDLWLARISDMILSRTTGAAGEAAFDPERWRSLVRNRVCTFSVWGYSHVFVHSPVDNQSQISICKGIATHQTGSTPQGLQEVFGPDLTRSILLHLHNSDCDATRLMRTQNGHPGFNKQLVRDLSVATVNTSGSRDEDGDGQSERSRGAVKPLNPDVPVPIGMEPEPTMERDIPVEYEENAEAEDDSIVDTEAHVQNSSSQLTKHGPQEALTAFLMECASKATASLEESEQWLGKTTSELRQALLARGLSAKLAEDFNPIITPNAAIIKLQGSKDMTVQAVEAKAEEIFTSSGLQIISIKPESGRVSIAVARPDRQVLHTPQVFLDLLQNPPPQAFGEQVFVGIREEDGKPMFLDPLSQPHTLVAGITGSGKSVLLQNLILYIALTRSPNDAQIHLIDAKYGVDYHPLELLPHVEAGSGSIIDEPEEAIASLDALVGEMDRRYKLFKEAKVKDHRAYRNATGRPLPSLWVIHDEFADWMQIEEYAKKVPEIVNRLSVKARAAGIFLVFAAQRPDNTVMPMQLRSQLGNRLILKVDGPGTSEVAMGQKNAGAERLLGKGHMLAKTGDTSEPVFVQVPYLDIEKEVPKVVQLLRCIYGLPVSDELPVV